MKLIKLTQQLGRKRKGESIRVSNVEARTLVALRRAEYMRSDLVAEKPIGKEPVRRYRRGDMTAKQQYLTTDMKVT